MHDAPQLRVTRPANVPPERVVDFDVHDPPGGREDLHGAWRALQEGPDWVWAPYHGGHWIPTRAEDIEYLQKTHDPFSMRDVTMPSGTRPTRLLPLEADPPEHTAFRAMLNPSFSPKSVAALRDFIRAQTVRLVEPLRPHGECEFMSEFALQMPIAVFLHLANLPMEDRAKLLRYAQMSTRGNAAERGEASRLMAAYLVPVIAARRAHPGNDLLSTVVHARIDGQPLNETDLMSVLLVLLFGGLDTVASTMGFIAGFLATSPAHRERLVATPQLIERAIEELMRRFSPSSTARTLTRDFDYKGIHFLAGDKVYVAPLLAGMDERRYPQAALIDFDRADKLHASFGNGPHRCPGSLLARTEIRIFLEEWLQRIPVFSLKAGERVVYGTGQVNCVERLMLAWPNI